MTVLRYKKSALAWDAFRGSVGVAGTAAAPLFVDAILYPIAVVCWCLAGIFGIYLLRTVFRHKIEIHVTQDAIMLKSLFGTREIRWESLKTVRLSYFASSKTKPGEGVLSLTLRGADTKIIVESSLTEFDRLAETVAHLCARPEIDIDYTSMHNFEAMGMPVQRS